MRAIHVLPNPMVVMSGHALVKVGFGEGQHNAYHAIKIKTQRNSAFAGSTCCTYGACLDQRLYDSERAMRRVLSIVRKINLVGIFWQIG